MQITASRWGNSLGVRIPRDIAERVGLSAGDSVDVEAKGGHIIISVRRPRPCYRLADLLVGMTPDAMRDAFDWGPDVGREIVDE